ncbi:hypothetical protein BDQ17DRAFT_1368655 [Cyathus striatus]|nr:hypothetical protein BDQ17DRAFT_1368655 [Cyathus striatus]
MTSVSFDACETLPEFKRINNKRGWILGCVFSAVGYGIGTTLFVLCFNHLRKRTLQRPQHHSQSNVLLWYISFLWALDTIGTAIIIYVTIGALERTCPEPDQIPVNPYFGKANVVYFALSWCSESLLVWRCKVIFSGSRTPPWVYLGVPCTLLAISFGVGISTAVLSTISRTKIVNILLIVYAIVTLFSSVVVTSMLVTRLALHRRRMMRVLHQSSPHYAGIMAMFVESAVLVVIMNTFFVIAFGLNSWYGAVAWQMWVQVQSIAPLLIVSRVAQGKAWSSTIGDTSISTPPIVLVSQDTNVQHSKGEGSSNEYSLGYEYTSG